MVVAVVEGRDVVQRPAPGLLEDLAVLAADLLDGLQAIRREARADHVEATQALLAEGLDRLVRVRLQPGLAAEARLKGEQPLVVGQAEPLRDLGVIYMRTGRTPQGYDALRKAFARDDDDPMTLFYLGIANEKLGKNETALRLFERYSSVPSDSPYRDLMEGRYQWLVREIAREEIRAMIAREEEMGGEIDARVVAVLPLAYQGGNERYAPLGRGLSEMLTVDLATIRRIRVVERVRLQALLDELELAQSSYVDPSSAPRVGRLLGAGRLVGGAYNVLGDEELRMDVALAELERQATSPDFETRSGALDDLFQLEKELVFRVIDRLGIELTPEEREAIETVPTRNLQAFLAYSRGLLEQDRGNYAAAAEAFGRAHQLDPDFEEAAEREQANESLSVAAGPPDQALIGAIRLSPPLPAASSSNINLLDNRLQEISQTVGTEFIPTQDARQPAAESSIAVPSGFLPDPPDPPRGQNQ